MSARHSLMVGVALCSLAVGCSDSDVSSKLSTTVDSSTATDGSQVTTTVSSRQPWIDLLPEVVRTMHPGFEFVQLLSVDGNAYIVEARHTRVPELRVNVWYASNSNQPEFTRSADVGGITWTTPTALDQLTDQSTLITGELQHQLLHSIVNDTGFVHGNAGRYITYLGVNSNVEVFARVIEADGTTVTDYLYRLDMTASPAVFRYVG